MNNKSNQRCCERSEQTFRPKGEMNTRSHKRPQEPKDLYSTIKDLMATQLNTLNPHWFGTVQWIPFITDPESIPNEAKHFNNKLFCALLNCRPKNIPLPPERPRIIWFHEKTNVLVNPNNHKNPKYKNVYHSHFHLGQCPEPFDSHIALDWLIRSKVLPRFHQVSTNNSYGNKGFLLKQWNKAHHANYNLKDYRTYMYDQDFDLILDYENSDLDFSRN